MWGKFGSSDCASVKFLAGSSFGSFAWDEGWVITVPHAGVRRFAVGTSFSFAGSDARANYFWRQLWRLPGISFLLRTRRETNAGAINATRVFCRSSIQAPPRGSAQDGGRRYLRVACSWIISDRE